MTTAHNEPGTQTEAHSDKAAIEQAANDARVAERARVAGIVGSEEAKGRSALANHFAMHTDMSIEQARAALVVAPQESAGKPSGNPFESAMNADKHPNVGADAHAGEKAEDDNPVARILASHAAVTGLKLVKSA